MKNNRSCIIFACTILSQDRLFVLDEFINSFDRNFQDSDIYVGINYNSISQVEDIILKSNLKIKGLKRGSAELYTESDASAYQAALQCLYDSKEEYDSYWFVHTKSGVNSHSDYLRDWYIKSLIDRRVEVESFLESNSEIGSYGILGLEFDPQRNYNEQDTEVSLFNNDISSDLPYTHANFFYIHTLYVLTRNPINKFFSLITDVWFSSKLDRYYFEGVFPFIVSRSGYFPYIENIISCTGKDLTSDIELWIRSNNLEKYNKYINSFKTKYSFNQLYPPYVNSNTQP